jgi:hypothetical protein
MKSHKHSHKRNQLANLHLHHLDAQLR